MNHCWRQCLTPLMCFSDHQTMMGLTGSKNRTSPESSKFRDVHLFPKNFKPLKVLGQGSFGEVLETIKKDTREMVAVKVLYGNRYDNELSLHKLMKEKHLEACNIVRFIDWFSLKDGRLALVFEMLDMTLLDFMCQRELRPLNLHEVRTVVQQVATALDALKSIHVIHADIKMDSIMLVDHRVQPLQVKLLDFGAALPSWQAKQGSMHQTAYFTSVEILLGLPFSEAIDVWSLGVVMLAMVFGLKILPARHFKWEVVRWLVYLLGAPPDHLLEAGTKSKCFFHQTSSGHWKLNGVQSFSKHDKAFLRSFVVEQGDEKECMELLLDMLQMDGQERITPCQVLAHPFIICSQ